MILDTLENLHQYSSLNKGFAKAIEFLLGTDLNELSEGEHEIDSENIFAVVAKDIGRAKEDAQLETHEKYIDIQLVLNGTDEMGWKPRATCTNTSVEYDSEKDVKFYADKPDTWILVKPGTFAIFFPEDAHLPMISSEEIHKVIIKVAV